MHLRLAIVTPRYAVGVELNAFLQEPARAAALAEATKHAAHGNAAYDEQTGQVRAESTGDAESAGPLPTGPEGSIGIDALGSSSGSVAATGPACSAPTTTATMRPTPSASCARCTCTAKSSSAA